MQAMTKAELGSTLTACVNNEHLNELLIVHILPIASTCIFLYVVHV